MRARSVSKNDIEESPLPEKEAPLTALEIQQKVGEFIRERREELSLDISSVANELKIRRFFLESIEKGDFHQLPGSVYTQGFVRCYAEHLGLDGVEIITALTKADSLQKMTKTATAPKQDVSKAQTPQWVWLLSGGVAAMVVGMFVYKSLRKEEAHPLPIDLPAATRPDQPAHFESVPIGPQDIVIVAQKPTWVKVTDDRGVLINARFLKAGEVLSLMPYDGKNLTVGDGSALRFKKGEQEIPLYFPEQTAGGPTLVENHPLDLQKLGALVPTPESAPLAATPQNPVQTNNPTTTGTKEAPKH
jgi:hypothetical protein